MLTILSGCLLMPILYQNFPRLFKVPISFVYEVDYKKNTCIQSVKQADYVEAHLLFCLLGI